MNAPMTRTEQAARARWAIGQVWSDAVRTAPQTVIAITQHPERPIVTQDEDGEIYCYSITGRYHSGGGKYDLTRLITDVPARSAA